MAVGHIDCAFVFEFGNWCVYRFLVERQMKVNPLLIAIVSAACGFAIACALKPKPLPAESDTLPLADNLVEVRLLSIALENAKNIMAEQAELVKVLKARLSRRDVTLPKPSELRN